MIIPAEITAKHGVSHEEVFRTGGSARGIEDAVFEFASIVNDHMITARKTFGEAGEVKARAIPVFLAGVCL
jgi:NADH dehydrogenase [ubiquinone] 1 alpha subcomplex assembly factor 6